MTTNGVPEDEVDLPDESAFDEEAPSHVDPDAEELAHVEDVDPEAIVDEVAKQPPGGA